MDFSHQLPNWVIQVRKREAEEKEARAKMQRAAEDEVIMTEAEDLATKAELDSLELKESISIKEALFINEHTIKMAVGAPGEREDLRRKAVKTTMSRQKAELGISRIIHEAPEPVQIFCVAASKGTTISVENAIAIIREKDSDGNYPEAWMQGGWADADKFLMALDVWAYLESTGETNITTCPQSPSKRGREEEMKKMEDEAERARLLTKALGPA